MIRYQCPRCGREREGDDRLAGMTAVCLGCGERFVVPLLSLLGRREDNHGAPCPPPAPAPCPPLDLLRRALAGELSVDEPAALSRHLDECATCRLDLARLAAAHRVVPETAPSGVRPDKDVRPRRRLLRWACALLLLAGLLTWRLWPRPALEAPPPAPGWPSPLDLLDPDGLKNDDWPPDQRPAEAVGVLDLSRGGDGRLVASIRDGDVLIKNARGEEVAHLDYHMQAVRAFLSPQADRLVVLGTTRHTPTPISRVVAGAEDSVGHWAHVWRWEGDTLTPLEEQPLEYLDYYPAVFSLDGGLLALSGQGGVDVWKVGDKGLRHLGQIAGAEKPLVFAPDGRSLAVVKPEGCALYDLGPLLPGGSGWARWRLLWATLGLTAAVAVFFPVSGQSEAARAQRRLAGAARAASFGVGACVVWWACRPVPVGAPLTVGLGFGAALAILLLLARARRRSPAGGGAEDAILVLTALSALACLVWWAWQFWWPSPLLLTPSRSALAAAKVSAACFSPDGRELAAVRSDGRLSLFDAATGQETRSWAMPAGVARPELAADGRHLLAFADRKAYVLRLKPFDDDAFVLSRCEEVLSRDPKSAAALLARGHVRLHRGELDEAIADFTAAIGLDGKNGAAYLARGQALTDRGDYVGAKADFAEAVRLAPTLADPPKGK
jgi:hypothetical protein